MRQPFSLTRRDLLLAASGFWNRKEPAAWSSDEINRLINNSPWARPVTVSQPQSGRGKRGGGEFGLPGAGRVGGPDMGGSAVMQFKGVVRWESAKPVLEATKTPLPKAFANHYVIGVSGIPILSGRNVSRGASDDALDRIKNLTYLEPKGKDKAQPGVVQAGGASGSTRTILFGFSKEILQLTAADKELTFTSEFGNLPVKAKFTIKEMLYRGQLAL